MFSKGFILFHSSARIWIVTTIFNKTYQSIKKLWLDKLFFRTHKPFLEKMFKVSFWVTLFLVQWTSWKLRSRSEVVLTINSHISTTFRWWFDSRTLTGNSSAKLVNSCCCFKSREKGKDLLEWSGEYSSGSKLTIVWYRKRKNIWTNMFQNYNFFFVSNYCSIHFKILPGNKFQKHWYQQSKLAKFLNF